MRFTVYRILYIEKETYSYLIIMNQEYDLWYTVYYALINVIYSHLITIIQKCDLNYTVYYKLQI